jgi:probable rRNA maturation factor
MAIRFFEEDRSEKGLKRREAKRWLTEVIRSEGKELGEVNIVFCSDDYLAGVNRKFLNRDYYTDVISFGYDDPEKISGDIMISLDRIAENAEKMGVARLEELHRIMVHGVLHLLGYDDATDEMRDGMAKMEDLYLARLGVGLE